MGRTSAILVAGLAAGVASTVVQVTLWWATGADWIALLLRDSRLAAAVVLGRRVLPPPADFDPAVMMVATAVHFALSFAYAALLAPLIARRAAAAALAIGAAFGVALYAVNMYGFTLVYPWFAAARGWVTIAAHVGFGVAAAATIMRSRHGPQRERMRKAE